MQSNAAKPDLSTLKKIRSLELFNNDQLNTLAQSLTVDVAKSGEHIISAGEAGSYSLYILSGDAISRAVDGVTQKLKAMEDKMYEHAGNLEFELAAKIRDEMEELKTHYFISEA